MEISVVRSGEKRIKDFGVVRVNNPVYIAGPISGCPKKNWPAFLDIENQIGRAYCLTPHRINFIVDNTDEIYHDDLLDKSETVYFRKSVNALLNQARSIVLLQNWEYSKGSMAEYLLAKRLGLAVYEVSYTFIGNLYTPVGLVQVDY